MATSHSPAYPLTRSPRTDVKGRRVSGWVGERAGGNGGFPLTGSPTYSLTPRRRDGDLVTFQTAAVCPGMAMGYLPLASGMAGGLDSQV